MDFSKKEARALDIFADVPDSERKGMIHLLNEGDFHDVEGVLAHLRQRMIDNPEVLAMGTREYFQIFCSGARFASEEYRVFVGLILDRFVTKRNPLPNFTKAFESLRAEAGDTDRERIYIDLGSKCLVSGGFFRKALERRGLSDFYDRVGISSFRYAGHDELADTFGDWTAYMAENAAAA